MKEEKNTDEISSLKERIKKLECELDNYKDRLYCLCPPLPTNLWDRSKNVWGSALHSYLYGQPGDPGPMAIIERALFDAEKRRPSGRKDPGDKVHCNGECNCSSKKVKKDDSKKTQTTPTKKKRATKGKK